MGKRQTGRKLAMQILFQLEYDTNDNNFDLENFFIESSVKEESKLFAISLASNAWKFKTKSDAYIKKYAIDWDFSRLSSVDKALLRLGFYEIINTNTSPSVIINEVVELAKVFSSESSSSFINGILGSYLKDNV